MRISNPIVLVPLFALALGACTHTAVVTPPEPAGPPRGAALRRAVVGTWHGTAHDGTSTTEAVTLTLADDHYALKAGIVDAGEGWSVRDDFVYLVQDADDQMAEGGICFRGSAIEANHIVGTWGWADGAANCDENALSYEVVLDRTN